MHIFQRVQRGFAFVGITAYQSTQRSPFNRRNLATLFSYTLTVISFNVYLVHVAKTFWEYNDNIYTNSASTLTIICYTFLVLNMTILFKIIDDYESIAADSEYTQIEIKLQSN